MGVFAWVAWYAFRRHTAYPLASLAEAVTNTVFGFLRAYVLTALWAARPHLGGYDATDAVTFTFLTQALIGPVQIFGGLELSRRIRTGDVAIDLYRPAGLQAWWLADDLGRAAGSLVLRGGLPLAAGFLAFDLRAPGPAGLAACVPSFALAIVTGFALRYLVALGAFWLHDDRGLASVALVLSLFLSGMIVPLVVFPGPAGDVARALPWSALVQVPAEVFLGKRTGAGLASALAFQAAWAAALLAAGALATRRARRRLVIHGG
ncbi:ABC transporter permease [Actinomadura parmotrematis]|uniref:ABC-2 family transporter protein n=1 Tax=Actinomadura parmotrematis TaxID=2864039 RepID=A0ABS7G5I5_9ACTN|nr:ABC-2 family transporter protein [Actinomadura parmotrematis]MBW8487134.1 ABC-2 family transporter protein [Actinomadura parmotrematis]